jgi:glycine hydroxymethyltransferase
MRIGTPALTTRGMKEQEMKIIAGLISNVLAKPEDEDLIMDIRATVADLCRGFPIYDFMDSR